MYQMSWEEGTFIFYDLTFGDLILRLSRPEGGTRRQQIATGVKPEDIGSFSMPTGNKNREVA
jgi:hypothetical protein